MEIARIEVGRTTGTCTRRGRIPAGVVGASVQVLFTDPVWDRLIKTVVFRGKETRIAEFDGTVAVIPHEVVAEPGTALYFGIFGHDPETDLQIPLIEVRLGTTEKATDANADPGTDPALPIWAQLQKEIEEIKQQGPGPEVEDGEDGGYYTPAVTQLDEDTIQFKFTPSKPDMPDVGPVTVELPSGQGSGGKVVYDKAQKLTDEQKEQARTNIGAQPSGDYALRSEIPNIPVQSVNGKTGVVQLSASDVGARPDNWMPTANQIGADPMGTALTAVAKHNTSEDSHNDIRLDLQAINNRLTAFFDSDEQTLDELSEIVAYITSNKTLIDSITTSKVSVADIINNLTTNVSNKPLSAAQGVILKGMIDTISSNLSNYQPKGDYLTDAQLKPVKETANDALALATQVKKSVPIVESASGDVITVSDASDMELAGLKVFGKTTQNGTPTPDAPVPLESVGDHGSVGVTVCGKNLLTAQQMYSQTGGYLETTMDGRNCVRMLSNRESIITPDFLKPHTQYTVSLICKNMLREGETTSQGNMLIRFNYEDGTGSYLYNKGANSEWVSLEHTSSAGKTVVSIGVYSYDYRSYTYIDVDTFQLEEGATATEYEPYRCQTLTIQKPTDVPVFLPGIPVNSGGNYTDENGQQWVCDEVDFEKGVYVQRVRCMEYDGSNDEAWVMNTENAIGTRFYIPNYIMLISSSLLCSKYQDKLGVENAISTKYGAGRGIWVVDNDYATVEEFKDSLKNNPMTVLVILATPIEYDLTEEELAQYAAIHTNYPNTTIFNDSGADMEVKYVADTKLYIDKKFAELSAALLNQ